jgi:ABC-type branched-subunit amino acid transport system ATPase component
VTIIDEPGQGLDPEDLADLAELIARRAEGGSAYLLISQRAEFAALAHRRLVIEGGAVIEAGGRP